MSNPGNYPPPGGYQPGGYQQPGGYPPPGGYGMPPAVKPPGADKKLPAGLCGILLNGLGVHKFILGYQTEGIIMLVTWIVGIFLCGIPSLVVSVIGIIEGVIYLTKSDEDFVRTYIIGRKPWF